MIIISGNHRYNHHYSTLMNVRQKYDHYFYHNSNDSYNHDDNHYNDDHYDYSCNIDDYNQFYIIIIVIRRNDND